MEKETLICCHFHARLHKTLLLQDGRAPFWEEALEEALTL